ncbi:RraA family protein [Glaciibacter superstes]|uniref:RraA family protein n=1 Tax=Glaciibacter superstes TaxID=501023 RepID=UPI000401BD2B|nr:RraA family protein [Glaciibacter superstes]
MSSSRALSTAEQKFLAGVDSPTVANAIERFAVRDRTEGFIGGAVQCTFPDLGSMVGRALTVTMSNAPGEPAQRDGYWRMWDALEQMEGPVVLVIADASGAPERVAYSGEIMSRLAQRLGAVGMVTDGGLRDIEEVRAIGFHYFMRFPVVSHANYEIVAVGEPVNVNGQRVKTGDLLHGDRNGVVVVPWEVLDRLHDEVENVRRIEATDMDLIKSDGFTLAAYKAHRGYGS